MPTSYEADYMETTREYETALRKRDALDGQLEALERRIQALETLIGDSLPAGKRTFTQSLTNAQGLLVWKNTLTDAISALFHIAKRPLTTGEIVDGLRQFGWDLGQTNPWALVAGVAARLVDRGEIQLQNKGNRRAWVRA
jgi:hypothetical protein